MKIKLIAEVLDGDCCKAKFFRTFEPNEDIRCAGTISDIEIEAKNVCIPETILKTVMGLLRAN